MLSVLFVFLLIFNKHNPLFKTLNTGNTFHTKQKYSNRVGNIKIKKACRITVTQHKKTNEDDHITEPV